MTGPSRPLASARTQALAEALEHPTDAMIEAAWQAIDRFWEHDYGPVYRNRKRAAMREGLKAIVAAIEPAEPA